ncbi:polyphosphate kinase 2 family protein [Chloroflexales bacterium ZM16-3]|nr:polyphosphate kinase 2 family protein [Chloroflexales bacterium ZM16-3]
MSSLTHKVEPGSKISLSDYDPRYEGKVKRKDAEDELEKLTTELDDLQELLYGAGTHSLLVVMQGMDTSGKDSTVRTVFGKVSPLGSYVAPFKVPTEDELAHDFLWRVHKVTPRKGQIGIFNRSHYEDVLVVRVHGYVPEKVWKARYKQINNFEQLLADSGTIILKFFLNISREEQEQRLLEREQETEKAWKLAAGDWRERELWDKYMVAYDDALGKCSTEHAPWHIVPADRKWFRNYAVASTIVETLRGYKDGWMETLGQIGVAAKAELEVYRAEVKS